MIMKFEGLHHFLSNTWPARVRYEDFEYPTVEHAYQAAKSLDHVYRLEVRAARTVGEARLLGRHALLRVDWPDIRVTTMWSLVHQKFCRWPELGEWLVATGDDMLIDGNMRGDDFWGICQGRGENWLGRILMDVRKELRNEQERFYREDGTRSYRREARA